MSGGGQSAVLDRLAAVLRDFPRNPAPLAPAAGFGSGFPEVDCVRPFIRRSTLEAACTRAQALGVGADRVLVGAGVIDDEFYARALAQWLGLAFDSLDAESFGPVPLERDLLIKAASHGILPLLIDGALRIILAPRLNASRGLIELHDRDPALAGRFRITTQERFDRFVLEHGSGSLARHATEALQRVRPSMSAAPPRWHRSYVPLLILSIIAAGFALFAFDLTKLLFYVTLGLTFWSWFALRSVGIFLAGPRRRKAARIPNADLPIYTVMVALYREAKAVRGLVAALKLLDYPREKLDVKFVIEADDAETKAALDVLELGPPFEVIVAPSLGPRTKPKALNAALPFAYGTFTVIYDAEDRPEPQQLRRAIEAFAGDAGLSCVQACLTIDNTKDNWLTRVFTAEYATQFDVFLPALARLNMPLPLGGSSNHFRTAILREVGAWDPYNVTEDADLGMRLARLGLRATTIDSTTYEEAPARFYAWLKQRTRWFKGWAQTWLVHMREPLRLLRELKLRDFLIFQLVVGGSVLAALVHPLFVGFSIGVALWHGAFDVASVAILAVGYVCSAVLAAVGLWRRNLLEHSWALLAMPVHWFLLSAAAWRALPQLFHDPYRWEKTEHGLAKTSRTGESQVAAGTTAPARQATAAQPTYTSASRPPLPQAAASG